ncbi:MAG: hypothetical protein EKK55_01805 [Rhodocyclaceae bacterium]|nr:MAG: hypothetical protein EKK55_01805 [Rhodocyclaceae bacterium]
MSNPSPPPTPAAISDALAQAVDLGDEGPLALLLAYRQAKRRTGCPVDLENEVVRAARRCVDAAGNLRKHLENARVEADAALADLAEGGTKFFRTWHALDGRTTAEQLGKRLREERTQFNALLTTWAIVADRIQATAEERRAALRARWEDQPIGVMRATFKARTAFPDATPPKTKEGLLAALVEEGIEPPEPGAS